MKQRVLYSAAVAVCAACASTKPANEITVARGQSIQAAIDASRPGGVIRLVEGGYLESITITKPITLVGAGWDKTLVGDEAALPSTSAPSDPAASERARTPRPSLVPTITVRDATGVTIQGIRIRGPESAVATGRLSDETLVLVEGSAVKLVDCAVLGPSMNGVSIASGSDVRIERCLVAAFWGTGVQVYGGAKAGDVAAARAHVVESDIRNCYHRGMTIGSDDVLVERCRISGSAWHGIRYDGCAPTIRANQIFGNARCGIYASGKTAAHVTGNVFWKNDLGGMSCWYDNRDVIEGNTFAANPSCGVSVLGRSAPRITKNLFVENAPGVGVNNLEGVPYPGLQDPASPLFSSNVFFANGSDFQIAGVVVGLPSGNESIEPRFVSRAQNDFALAADCGARLRSAGAADPISASSPFPIQAEETAIIPDGEKRDFTLWKK